jgi:hypothetical protein
MVMETLSPVATEVPLTNSIPPTIRNLKNKKVVTHKDYDLFSFMVPKAGFEPARP